VAVGGREEAVAVGADQLAPWNRVEAQHRERDLPNDRKNHDKKNCLRSEIENDDCLGNGISTPKQSMAPFEV
jgi:hypothetical protein